MAQRPTRPAYLSALLRRALNPARWTASWRLPVAGQSAVVESQPRAMRLKKIPQSGEFNDLLRGQNSGDQFTLRSGVNLIQMTRRCRLGDELPDAFVKGARNNEVGTGAPGVADAVIVERWPLPENRRRLKFDLNVAVRHASCLSFAPLVPSGRCWAPPPPSGCRSEAGAVPAHEPARIWLRDPGD